MSLLEALATGLPAVSTEVGEVPRIISPGKNGEISRLQDSTALSNAIAKVLRDTDRYQPEGCASSVSQYTPAVVLAETFERYRACLKSANEAVVIAP